jgi:hypothetical protein
MGPAMLLAAAVALFGSPGAAADAGAAEGAATGPPASLPAPDSVFSGRVVEVGSDRPVSAATVLLVDAAGARRAGSFTLDDGTFRLSIPARPGDELRVERLGYAPVVHPLGGDGAPVPQRVELEMEPRPVEFSAIEVTAEARCDIAPTDAGRTYDLWEATRIALQAAELTETEALSRHRIRVWQHRENQDASRVEGLTWADQVAEGRPFETLPPSELAERGHVQTDRDERIVHGPDARILLSDAFANSHCFRVVASTGAVEEGSGESWIGLAFEPAPDPADIVKIGGTLWLDRASGQLRLIEFRFLQYQPRFSTWTPWGADSGGTIRYRALADGRWVVESWSLRALSGVGAPGLWYDVAGGLLLEVLDGDTPF